MKRIFTVSLTLMCLMALLTGCGSKQTDTNEPAADGAQQEQKTHTPDEIAENDTIQNLLAHHSALGYDIPLSMRTAISTR